MSDSKRTIAILAGTPALSSIIATTLATKPSLRVREFETLAGLETYMRIAPVELIVADFDHDSIPAGELARWARGNAGVPRHVKIVALAGRIDADTRAQAAENEIDEVIVKPMSPRYLVERVLARIGMPRRVARTRTRVHRDWSSFGDNIVPLFRQPVSPQP